MLGFGPVLSQNNAQNFKGAKPIIDMHTLVLIIQENLKLTWLFNVLRNVVHMFLVRQVPVWANISATRDVSMAISMTELKRKSERQQS